MIIKGKCNVHYNGKRYRIILAYYDNLGNRCEEDITSYYNPAIEDKITAYTACDLINYTMKVCGIYKEEKL